MSGVVTGLSCDVLGDSVIVKAEYEGDCTLEVNAASAMASEFYAAYGKRLELIQ